MKLFSNKYTFKLLFSHVFSRLQPILRTKLTIQSGWRRYTVCLYISIYMCVYVCIFALQYIHVIYKNTFFMFNRSAALSHRGLFFSGGQWAGTPRGKQSGSILAGSLTCTSGHLPNTLNWKIQEGRTHTVAPQSSTSFQVFPCVSSIPAHAIMSQKSPYSNIITNIYIVFFFFCFQANGQISCVTVHDNMVCLCWHPEMKACIIWTPMVGRKPVPL